MDVKTNTLDLYRKQSSFCPKKLQEFIETKEVVLLKEKLFKILENDALFHKSYKAETHEELRRITNLRAMRLLDLGILKDPIFSENPLGGSGLVIALVQYDPSVLFKTTFSLGFFGKSIKGLGTSEHNDLLEDAISGKITGCFALTEVSHGSNAKNMRTTATFDKNTQQFILHTEDFEAAKCWAGNMGHYATHATVFAQLITPDGQCHGLHPFIVPLRDLNTHQPFTGVIIGDMGEKIGLNGIDNGYCMFNHYRIPKRNLLSKIGNVTEDGEYISPISDPRKRFGASLGTLVGGRIGVCMLALAYYTNAIVIAVRYSAVRRQFGEEDDKELSIIEYQLQQVRVFPHMAGLFAMKVLLRFLNTVNFEISKTLEGEDPEAMMSKTNELLELHALSCSTKPLVSWRAVQAIQDCREACGGHGYLKCARLGELRDNNDGNCTYEGENNVLQQQTSNWLLSLWRQRRDKTFPSPLGSVDFLYRPRRNKMTAVSEQDVCHIPVILEAYQWLVCWLAEKTLQTLDQHKKMGKNSISARNASQVYDAKPLSMAYIEHFIIKTFWNLCNEAEDPAVKTVLVKLCALYALTSLEKHFVYFYQGGYMEGSKQSQLIQSAILNLCEQLKPEAVSLVDTIAPPDLILNSVLGHSNGEVYKNLQQAFLQTPGGLEKPHWWTEMTDKFRSRL